jgi:hypothetical protein
MSGEIATRKHHEVERLGSAGVPEIISAIEEHASFRFGEFFTANIGNPNASCRMAVRSRSSATGARSAVSGLRI